MSICVLRVGMVLCIPWLLFLLECVDVMVMSSAYVMSCTGGLGCGMSDV